MADEKTGADGKDDLKGGDAKGTENQTKDEPDFLKDPKVIAEIDRRAAQAAATREAKIRDEMTRATEEAKRKADEETLKKQGEFQKLAETRESELNAARAQIAELTPLQETAKKYEDLIAKNVKADIAALGLDKNKPILALLEKMPVAEQAEWIANNKADLLKQSGVQYPKTPGETKHTTTDQDKVKVIPLDRL